MSDIDLNKNIKPVLALVIVVFGLGYFYMCSIRNIKPDPQILIAMVSIVSGATGYYFGSSSSSSKKDDIIADAQAKPLATNVDTMNVAQPTDDKPDQHER